MKTDFAIVTTFMNQRRRKKRCIGVLSVKIGFTNVVALGLVHLPFIRESIIKSNSLHISFFLFFKYYLYKFPDPNTWKDLICSNCAEKYPIFSRYVGQCEENESKSKPEESQPKASTSSKTIFFFFFFFVLFNLFIQVIPLIDEEGEPPTKKQKIGTERHCPFDQGKKT